MMLLQKKSSSGASGYRQISRATTYNAAGLDPLRDKSAFSSVFFSSCLISAGFSNILFARS